MARGYRVVHLLYGRAYTIGYISVYYYTNCVSLKSACASLNVKLCILKNHFAGEGMKFGQLILRRIVKIVATKCHILKLKCTTIDFGWDSAPDPAGGAYSTPPAPYGLNGPYF